MCVPVVCRSGQPPAHLGRAYPSGQVSGRDGSALLYIIFFFFTIITRVYINLKLRPEGAGTRPEVPGSDQTGSPPECTLSPLSPSIDNPNILSPLTKSPKSLTILPLKPSWSPPK